jgi:MFS family permease
MLDRARAQLRRLSRNARLYLISNAIQSVSAGALAVLYTLFLSALGFSKPFIGLTIGIGAVGGGLGIIPASFVVRRLGWKNTLILSDVIGALALAIQLIYPNKVTVLATAVGVGVSVALILVVNSPFLAAVTAEADRTAVYGVNNALSFLAGVVGLFLGGFLPDWLRSSSPLATRIVQTLGPWLVPGTDARAYQLALLATGILALPSIIPVLMLTEPQRAPAAAPSGTSPLSLRHIDWPRVRFVAAGPIGKFAATQALVGFGAGLYGPYLNIYFVNVLGASTTYYGTLTAILAFLLAGASLVIVPIARRVGEVRAVVIAEALSLPFLVALGLVPTLLLASVVFLIRSPLMNAGNAPLQTVLMGAVREDERVVASGVYNVSWQVMGALGGFLGGTLIYWAGYPATFGIVAALYALSIFLLAIWFGRTPDAAPKAAPKPTATIHQ